MATRQKAAVASESPFDRLGAQVLSEPRVRLWPLDRAAHIFQLTHVTLGEWRRWRDVADANGLADPLDLEGAVLEIPADGAPTPAPFDFPATEDDAPAVTVDLSSQAQLGVGPVVLDASPELRGACVLEVEDVDFTSFTLALRGPREEVFGPPVAVALADFEGVNADEVQTIQRVLYADSGAALRLRFTLDAWLVVWLARYWPLSLGSVEGSARDALVVPLDAADAVSLAGVV